MKRSLVLSVVLVLEGVFQTETTSVTGTVGGSVTITCSHSYATTNVKYFCKGTCVDADILIKSSTQREGKYSIKDNGNTFYVTISNLEMSDGGVYWCGIERVGVDTYGEVTLTVAEESPGSNLKMMDSSQMVYLGTGLGVAVLALATVLLLFFRLRKRDVSMSKGKKDDVTYSKPSIQKKSQHANAASSVTGEPDFRINAGQPEVLYSNSRSEPEIQSDDLCYSTVIFSKHPACSAASPQTELTTYSSVNSKPVG
ncbi:LOW QUALITY PROTEIN: CMRF35-like molecule 7 [Xiphophorus couchianus]|uniref:LOW QUALITY PROTEIN: CMRF35-like molecule 7 n=1 Tax=Xiphophorus couchianus TaxID=32473 RepID=UPI001016F5B3|nr:LOW QUALITY PROTEIN: CMRF35-like molecule 7 [Xiphophorus couchianus]